MPPRGDRPTLALVGAKGRFARAILQILAMREDRWGEIRLLCDGMTTGTHTVRGREQRIETLTPESLRGVDIALFNLSAEATTRWAQIAVDAGAIVVDASGGHRLEDGVPLVLPEVNPERVHDHPRGIVSIPGPVALTAIDTAWVLHQGWRLRELVVTGLIASVSPGSVGMERLRAELDAVAGRRDIGLQAGDVRRALSDLPDDSPFPAPLALNVVPVVGTTREDGWTTLERKFADELRKVLDLPDLAVMATFAQVPVVTNHSLSVHATFQRRVVVERARQALVEAPEIVALDADGEYPTPIDSVGVDPRFVGRVRQDPQHPHTLDLFICADSLRRGAGALVRTAELLVA